MENQQLQTYAARISQANRSELVVIIYEIIVNDINSALKAFEDNEIELFEKELKHAQKFVSELMSTLNFNYEISNNLMQLYLYVNKSILTAISKKESEMARDALKVMEILTVGFEEVSKQDLSGPVMQNAQQLYAGLTYGRGTLNETYIDPSEQNRGFKA